MGARRGNTSARGWAHVAASAYARVTRAAARGRLCLEAQTGIHKATGKRCRRQAWEGKGTAAGQGRRGSREEASAAAACPARRPRAAFSHDWPHHVAFMHARDTHPGSQGRSTVGHGPQRFKASASTSMPRAMFQVSRRRIAYRCVDVHHGQYQHGHNGRASVMARSGAPLWASTCDRADARCSRQGQPPAPPPLLARELSFVRLALVVQAPTCTLQLHTLHAQKLHASTLSACSLEAARLSGRNWFSCMHMATSGASVTPLNDMQ